MDKGGAEYRKKSKPSSRRQKQGDGDQYAASPPGKYNQLVSEDEELEQADDYG